MKQFATFATMLERRASTVTVTAIVVSVLEADRIWYWIRESRSEPPNRARDDERRKRLYAAALHQFEELMRASEVVSPMTRPLPLYYALTQAGRAIAAAHSQEWNLHGHGLKLSDPMTDLLATEVRPHGGGIFQETANVTGSATLSGPVQIGALWASLPELAPTADEERWLAALEVRPGGTDPTYAWTMLEAAEAQIRLEPGADSAEEARRRLENYPSMGAGWTIAEAPGGHLLTSLFGVRIRWAADEPPVRKIDLISPEYRFEEERWLRPGLGANLDALSPLMTWWALAFAFSILARYHPSAWRRALDVDASELAAPLEYALEEALTAIPHLVLEALWAEPVAIRRSARL